MQPKLKRKISKTETGFILMAKPYWRDEIYRRSVILVTKHDEFGATGLILNRKSDLKVSKVLKIPKFGKELYFGGPMDVDMVVSMHTIPDIPDSVDLGNGLYLMGDVDWLKEHGSRFQGQITFLAGSVQWNAGQLEQELKDDKWWIGEIGSEYFRVPAESLWGEKLEEIECSYGLFEDVPDPSLN